MYVYICTCVCVCVYIYIYIYIYLKALERIPENEQSRNATNNRIYFPTPIHSTTHLPPQSARKDKSYGKIMSISVHPSCSELTDFHQT